jgi:hypothetical protein
MDPAYPKSLTSRGGIYKIAVAGPKKKEPSPLGAKQEKE